MIVHALFDYGRTTVLVLILALTLASVANAMPPPQFTDYGQPLPNSDYAGTLVLDGNGRVYGASMVWSSNTANLFIFDPSTHSFSDKGQTPGNGTAVLAWGPDGKLYGGGHVLIGAAGWISILWAYDPELGGFSAELLIPDDRTIVGLAAGQDGLMYIGTEPNGRLFSFDPATHELIVVGGLNDVSVGIGLIQGPDGKIYGGTASVCSYHTWMCRGRFFVYDPTTHVLIDKGQPVVSQRSFGALTVGKDGKIYGSALIFDTSSPSWSGPSRLFSYDPIRDTFADLGVAVIGQDFINCLEAFGNKVYGCASTYLSDPSARGYLFEYDTATQSFGNLGTPIQQSATCLADVVVDSAGMIYGGTGGNESSGLGHFFSYGVSPSSLKINYATGQIGSFFTLTGRFFEPNSPVTVEINGRVLTTILSTDDNGGFTLILDTSQADNGRYLVAASAGSRATIDFALIPAAPLRLQEGSGLVFYVPGGIAFTVFMHLPLVAR